MLLNLAYTETAVPGPSLTLFLPLLLLMGWLVYSIFKQRKNQKQINDMRNSMKVGDKVVTIGGMMGRIAHVDDEKVTLDLNGNSVSFTKWAIREVLSNDIE